MYIYIYSTTFSILQLRMVSLTLLIFFLTFNGHFGANTFLELLLNMTKHDYDHTFISKNVSNIICILSPVIVLVVFFWIIFHKSS